MDNNYLILCTWLITSKQVSKKLVNSDFKNGRINNPYKISSKQEQGVKKFVTGFFDKAVIKYEEGKKKKEEKKARYLADKKAKAAANTASMTTDSPALSTPAIASTEEEDVTLTDHEISDNEDGSNASKKRKRDFVADAKARLDEEALVKRAKTEDEDAPTPPPPPPPPMAIGAVDSKAEEG